MKANLKTALLGMGLMVIGATGALANGGDSSADATSGFSAVQASTAVIIRVPVNAQGQELTDAAEMRLHNGDSLSTSGDFKAAFQAAAPMTSMTTVSSADVAKDSSTSGWYGWGNNYNYCGWQNNYYSYYQPSYYNCGSYYSYYQPYHRDYDFDNYNDYYRDGCSGYRYYYYNRRW